MEKINIILADDHDIVMDGMASILNEAPGLHVVAKASSAPQALTLMESCQPDLLLTDISMGEMSGLELTREVTQKFPLVRIIVLSMHDEVQHISALLQAGANGYLLKNVKQDELFRAIKTVIEGGQYIQQSIATAYARSCQQLRVAEKKSGLTPREIEIIRLIASEMTTTEISRHLFLSEHTVETHRKNIGRKTGVKTAIGLINYAREHGLID